MRAFAIDDKEAFAVSVGGVEQLTLPKEHPALQTVDVFYGGPKFERSAKVRSAVLTRAGRVPGVQPSVAWLSQLPRATPGPRDDQRARTEHIAVATAYNGTTELRTVMVRGFDVYAMTARLLVWAALRIAQDGFDKSGALGPVEAFGLGPLREACAAAGLSVNYV